MLLCMEEIYRDNLQQHIDKIDVEIIGCWFTRNESAPDMQSTHVPLEDVTSSSSNSQKLDVDVFCICKITR